MGTRLVVEPRGNGQRLDIYLAAATELSRRAARRLIGEGGVRRNGESIRVQSRTVAAGDVIDLLLGPDDPSVASDTVKPPITVLHQDRSLLVADKPSGVLSQPSENSSGVEIAFDHLVLTVLALQDGRRPFLRMVHRLDRMTSGAVLFACRPEALSPLTRAWSDGIVDRSYLAVVEGLPDFESTIIDHPIARDRGHRWRFVCDSEGKNAQTEVSVVQKLESGLSVLRCRLLTGRTHQVRVHLAHIGLPVLGDRLYGSLRAAEAPRSLLHAASIALPHPETGEPIRVSSPIPNDMAKFGVKA